MFKLQMKIGRSVLTFESSRIEAIHSISTAYGMLPEKCDSCGSIDIHLNHRNPGKFNYYGVRCKDCGAELNFHQKEKGGFYLKQGEKMEIYKKKENNDLPNPTQNSEPQEEPGWPS